MGISMSGTGIHWQVEQSMQVAQKGQSDQLAGVQALVVGLAREGTALARFLVQHGAEVTVTDIRPASELSTFLDALAGLPVGYALGGHPPTLLDDRDIIFVSPGVPPEIPLLSEARRRGLSEEDAEARRSHRGGRYAFEAVSMKLLGLDRPTDKASPLLQ